MSLEQYLKVVICFIILTDLTKFFVKFCVDEVFEERGVTDMRRIRRGKSVWERCMGNKIFLHSPRSNLGDDHI